MICGALLVSKGYENMAVILTYTFWMGLIVGLALAVVWRFVPPGRLRTTLQIGASLLVFIPQLLMIFLLNCSMELLL